MEKDDIEKGKNADGRAPDILLDMGVLKLRFRFRFRKVGRAETEKKEQPNEVTNCCIEEKHPEFGESDACQVVSCGTYTRWVHIYECIPWDWVRLPLSPGLLVERFYTTFRKLKTGRWRRQMGEPGLADSPKGWDKWNWLHD